MFNPVIPQQLGIAGITARKPSYGHRFQMDYQTTLGNIMAEFLYVKFNAIVVGTGGIPLAITWDATNGIWVATGTYAAALNYSFGCFSLPTFGSVSYAVGDMDYVQCAGPNVMTIQSAAAIAAGKKVQHNGAGTTVKICDPSAVPADAGLEIGVLTKAQGGAGTIGVGELAILRKF